ncbi:MAG: four helix bundle protein [Ignavibacteriales bacterium]|nr:four helix bundle protein [Ignavibacteriales bacterium]
MQKAHKKLKVWQEAMELVKMVYEITSKMPSEEKFGLISQMRRASVSVPSNIAEGAARQGMKESTQFYLIARASLSELDTQIELCKILKFISDTQFTQLNSKVETVDSLLSGLIRYNKQKLSTNKLQN